MELIQVHEAWGRAAAESIQAMLKESDIEAVIHSSAPGGTLSGREGGADMPFGSWTISVSERDADRARSLLLSLE